MESRLILRFIFRLLILFLCSLLMPRPCVMSTTSLVFMMRLETMCRNIAIIRMICRISSRILLRVKLRHRRPERKGLQLILRIHRLNHLIMILSRFISVLDRCHVRARALSRASARVLPDGPFSKIRTYEYVRTFDVVASVERSIFEDMSLLRSSLSSARYFWQNSILPEISCNCAVGAFAQSNVIYTLSFSFFTLI